jgi:hypothetical protein
MPKITDPKVREGKINRNNLIREQFESLINDGRTVDYILDKLKFRFGLSESTIMQIIKEYGSYKVEQEVTH